MNTPNTFRLDGITHRFMQEFLQGYSDKDARVQYAITDCFRRNIDNMSQFIMELQTLSLTPAEKSDLLGIYGRSVSGSGTSMQTELDSLPPGKRAGGPLESVSKRQHIQSAPAISPENTSLINTWIQNGEADFIEKSFALVGGCSQATDDQLIEVCIVLVDALKNNDVSVFTSQSFKVEMFSSLLALLQPNMDIRVILAASACMAEISEIKVFTECVITGESTEILFTLLEEVLESYLNDTVYTTSPFSLGLQKLHAEEPATVHTLLINLCKSFGSCRKDKLDHNRLAKLVENLFVLLKSAYPQIFAAAMRCLTRISAQLGDKLKDKPLQIAEKCFDYILPGLESESVDIASASLIGLGSLAWHESIRSAIQPIFLPKIFTFASHPDERVVLALVSKERGFFASMLTGDRMPSELMHSKDFMGALLLCLSHENLVVVREASWLLGTYIERNLFDSQPASVQHIFDAVFHMVKKYTNSCCEDSKRELHDPLKLSRSASQLEKIVQYGCRSFDKLKNRMTIDQAEKILELWLAYEGFPFSNKLCVCFLCFLGPLFAVNKELAQYAEKFQARCLPLFFQKFVSDDSKVLEAAIWGFNKLSLNATTAKQILTQFDWEYAFKLLDHPSERIQGECFILISLMIAAQGHVSENGIRFMKKCLEMIDKVGLHQQLLICRAFNTIIKLSWWPPEDVFQVREKILKLLQARENPASILLQEAGYWCLGNMQLTPAYRQATDVKELWPLLQGVFTLAHDKGADVEFDKVVEGACFCWCNLMENSSQVQRTELLSSMVGNRHPKLIEACLWFINLEVTKLRPNKSGAPIEINRQFGHFILNQLSSSNEKIRKGALWCTLSVILFKTEHKFLYRDDVLKFVVEKVGDILLDATGPLEILALRVLERLANHSPSFAEAVYERMTRANRTIGSLMKFCTTESLGLIAALSSLPTVKKQLIGPMLVLLVKQLQGESCVIHTNVLSILKNFNPELLQNNRNTLIELGSKFLMISFPVAASKEMSVQIKTLGNGDTRLVQTVESVAQSAAEAEKLRREAAIVFLADFLPQGECHLPLEVLSEKANLLLTWLQTGDSAHPVETARLLVSFLLARAAVSDSQIEKTLLMHPQQEIAVEGLPLLEKLFNNDPTAILQWFCHFETLKTLCSFPPSPQQESLQKRLQADHKLVTHWEEQALHAEGLEYHPLVLWLYPSKEVGLQRLNSYLKNASSSNLFLNALQLCSQLNLGSELMAAHPAPKLLPYLQSDVVNSQLYAAFYANEDLKDFELKVGGESIRCHKLVLAQYPYFKAMILKLRNGENSVNVEIDAMLGDPAQAREECVIFKQVVEFMYLKQLSVTSVQQVLNCLQVAQKYLIQDLECLCISILKDLLHPETFSEIFDVVSAISCKVLVDYAKEWLQINYGRFSAAERQEIAARWEDLAAA